MKELRDLDFAQQYDSATHKGELYSIAMEAVKEHFKPVKGQMQYISLLLLEALRR